MALFTPWGPGLRRGDDSASVYLRRRSLFRMKWLNNPFVLVVEGFVAGAILLATTSPDLVDSRPAHPARPLDSSVIPNPSR